MNCAAWKPWLTCARRNCNGSRQRTSTNTIDRRSYFSMDLLMKACYVYKIMIIIFDYTHLHANHAVRMWPAWCEGEDVTSMVWGCGEDGVRMWRRWLEDVVRVVGWCGEDGVGMRWGWGGWGEDLVRVGRGRCDNLVRMAWGAPSDEDGERIWSGWGEDGLMMWWVGEDVTRMAWWCDENDLRVWREWREDGVRMWS